MQQSRGESCSRLGRGGGTPPNIPLDQERMVGELPWGLDLPLVPLSGLWTRTAATACNGTRTPAVEMQACLLFASSAEATGARSTGWSKGGPPVRTIPFDRRHFRSLRDRLRRSPSEPAATD